MEYGTVLLIPLVHELGHWLAARLFGASLHFTFEWGRIGPIKVPCQAGNSVYFYRLNLTKNLIELGISELDVSTWVSNIEEQEQ